MLRRRTVKWAIGLVLAWFAYQAVQQLVGAVDWAAVGRALTGVEVWVFAPLVLLLVVRQALNATPLTYFVEGLGLVRSVQNDTVANLFGTIAPPPADVVVRVQMFRSWSLDPVFGMTGVSLNSTAFYVIRFAMPVLGLLALGGRELEVREWILAGCCTLAAVVCLVALLFVARSDRFAALVGRTAARAVALARRSVDPDAWADYVVRLRASAGVSLRRGLVPSLLVLVAMVLADGAIAFASVRAFGVGADRLPLLAFLSAFLLAYPLTLLPLFGFGVLDAVLVGSLTTVAGAAAEPDLVAATLVWRFVTIAGTLVLGALSLAVWRLSRRTRDQAPDDDDGGASAGTLP